MASRIKPAIVPISERPWLLGDAELMGYSGKSDLKQYFFDRGFTPWRMLGKTKYYLKEDVYVFIEKHGDIPTKVRKEYAV